MLLVDLVAVCGAYGNVSLTSSDSNRIGPSSNCNDFNMMNTVNFNIHYCYGEQNTILRELVVIIIMVFPPMLKIY